MNRLIPRAYRWSAAALAGLVAALVALPTAATAQPAGPKQLTAADQALLDGVRMAGLWEIPAGQMAAEKGKRQRVRDIGTEISQQHVQLDLLVVEAANKLGAQLPSEPNADQKQWLNELRTTSGDRFDQTFVTRLRAAHGAIFPVIGAVRAGTRDPVIRKLAQEANVFVMNHMAMLESTGLVRYAELPPAAMPVQQDTGVLARARANAGPVAPVNPTIVWVVLLAALATGAVATIRLFRR